MTVTRLAPSPTGAQHLGNARTFLITWLAARTQNSTIILRIEDIDSPRVKPESVTSLAVDLEWLGLDWDVGPIRQTERLARYQDALAQLQQQERVYPCTCSRSDIAHAASAPHWEHEGPVYPGNCANRRASDAASLTGRPFAWRFRASDPGPFCDGFMGQVHLNPCEIGGDFVVWKSADTPAYQLAVVVDDAEMGVTHVIRGDDLLPSTPRQILLYQALVLPQPQFAHVPLVIGADGRRLAKRHGDTRLSAFREQGIAAERVVGLLAWSCGWIDRIEPISARDLLRLFQWATIPKQPFVVSPDVLAAIGFRLNS
ncbi:glutamate--trna ligase : Glutamyl-or glutaminyl-tRNA synthetase OS=Singulisphaera acidiphila (strain ATCC BAA-1392 / DSM 18658 / VKM B-2454 / MOB10) GN=Sinac_1159 PE=3 SV=1: tRNA-synt_1c [Tuwongella immobilis]|uniref:Glutamyl/glutaminyl-tRNA synthetase class Ib catalytic domain-containing protein n=2 Tax=Tuwongella immobilis TaxID=692036 RepID=A0A6C2YPG8_9BACT|nr:glutamate--trna ligase : Glutamyl-or glutaminyl-tRNA synthetase OS=Singulisphaera acidiphila (strain ATCC BAA-1392 / DSM 18658 / VKM B-2454 / MOB10) GN=Sinac_1159 PE=3 SV=1: tRNA-synt_1c [Tuwongella immobilis]VTS04388.1 glutamate--trna ligase : Glutamyl-or glutaminyl-tRNA synthetase OS=Singulisphaera acidiphila (strain ATCC BAA-1392 / DSM 18658 / VKM B-2454 / MOB10) GN=Sinac_1159 PE=3 SV=1: tRNA-synt_1c [Tuwongella immobilis]